MHVYVCMYMRINVLESFVCVMSRLLDLTAVLHLKPVYYRMTQSAD